MPELFINLTVQSFLERTPVWNISIKDWSVSLIIIVAALLLCYLLRILNRKVFQKIASKTNNRFDDILLQSLEAPVLWGILLLAILIAEWRLKIPGAAHNIMWKAYQILSVLNATWFFARLFSSLLAENARKATADTRTKKHIDKKFLPLARRVLLIAVWTIGVIMALSNAGISVRSLLATLGIGGIAFALAAQDTIKNIFGGITIFVDRPFSIGDTIRYDTIEGTVEDIGLRSTRIRTYEKRLVTIPNYKMMDAAITNISIEPKRRVLIKLGLTYDTTPAKMQEALSILRSIPGKIKNVDPKDWSANFTDYGDSALLITYIYNIKKGADIRAVTSDVNFEILNSFNNAGLEFAFPSQTVYLAANQNPESVPAFVENGEEVSSAESGTKA